MRMAQVEIVHGWSEEQRLGTSSTTSLRKAEVTYTENIEALLEQLETEGRDLEVVHNVDVSEVRQHQQKWRPSAEKEFYNLRDAKEAFEVRTKEALPPGTLIVPGKAVLTVKPPPSDSEARYKRKMRFVICVYFLKAEEGDLYAAGADASTLRLLLAMYAGKSNDAVGTTDVHQAFVLAPWTGSRSIAVQPPKLAVMLGLAKPGDLWLIKKALYGLKESPAIWSAFRDAQLKEARWVSHGKSYYLIQTEADPQLWGICQIQADGALSPPEAHALVYVDDLPNRVARNMQTKPIIVAKRAWTPSPTARNFWRASAWAQSSQALGAWERLSRDFSCKDATFDLCKAQRCSTAAPVSVPALRRGLPNGLDKSGNARILIG